MGVISLTRERVRLVLETKRLRLRPLTFADAGDLLEYHGDAEVVKYTPWVVRSLHDVEAATLQYQRLPTAFLTEGDSIVLGWELKSTGKVIGQSNASLQSLVNQTVDLGWVINRSFWRQGYAFEATHEFMGHLAKQSVVRRLVANIDMRNPESAGLAEKLGMRLEGKFKQAAYTKGEWCDMWLYALLSEDMIA